MWSGRMGLMGALLTSAMLGGCATGASNDAGYGPPYAGMPTAAASAKTTLVVENNNWQDMTLYLLRDGMKYRLGNVLSMGRQRFVLNNALTAGAGTLQIVADPLGSNRAWVSDPFMVRQGDEVQFKLENNISLSSYMIR